MNRSFYYVIAPTKTIKMVTLLFTATDKNLIVTGKTFYVKEQLKALGGIWQSPHWLLPLNADTPVNRAHLVEICNLALKAEKQEAKINEAARITYLASPEAVKDALQKKMAGDPSYHWICCDQCKVLDWNKQHTWCEACSADYGTHKECFRVRGMLRTGD